MHLFQLGASSKILLWQKFIFCICRYLHFFITAELVTNRNCISGPKCILTFFPTTPLPLLSLFLFFFLSSFLPPLLLLLLLLFTKMWSNYLTKLLNLCQDVTDISLCGGMLVNNNSASLE
jgi:hypothetical protein